MALESGYQGKLIRKLEKMYPGCFILKNDPGYRQGVPDLIVLYKDTWAALEVKKDSKAQKQPNQRHYVGLLDCMSFSAFIYPENEEEVLHDLQQTFGPPR